jgi:periplasmic divalent cation tolerance protein
MVVAIANLLPTNGAWCAEKLRLLDFWRKVSSDKGRFYMTDKRLVLTTAGSAEEAQRLAHALVEQRLAGCVNIVAPVESIYRWEEKIETAQEWLLLIKTTSALFPRLRDAIQQLHSYDVPECISLSIDDGSAPYLKWLDQSVSP